MTVFNQVKPIPPDPILGVISAHAADPNPQKIDLGVGVYRDEDGATPILSCVAKAEKILLDTQTTKTYLGPAGVPGFNQAIGELLFGADSPVLAEGRVCTLQTPGGTGALRLAADLIHACAPQAELWASDPTWSNHYALFPAGGITMHKYPYFDWQSSGLLFDEMVSELEQRGAGDIVLFHACCHNPSGVSPAPEQWRTVAAIAAERGFTPLIDIAYMGLERGQAEDCLPIRLFAERCPEFIVASSCSKNFAMYRERVGALSVVAENAKQAAAITTVLNSITRANYSMPPSHGPAVVDIILHSDELRALWDEELSAMRNRINGVRKTLVEKIAASGIQRDFSFLARQSGMFSFLGINREQIHHLRNKYSIYLVDSSRINVASFNEHNMDYFVAALADLIGD